MTLAFLAMGMASIMILTTLYTVKTQTRPLKTNYSTLYQPYNNELRS